VSGVGFITKVTHSGNLLFSNIVALLALGHCYRMPVVEKIGRRNSIPILYTRGTHYEVGFDVVGQNFSYDLL
jgi:hypothetical protein